MNDEIHVLREENKRLNRIYELHSSGAHPVHSAAVIASLEQSLRQAKKRDPTVQYEPNDCPGPGEVCPDGDATDHLVPLLRFLSRGDFSILQQYTCEYTYDESVADLVDGPRGLKHTFIMARSSENPQMAP